MLIVFSPFYLSETFILFYLYVISSLGVRKESQNLVLDATIIRDKTFTLLMLQVLLAMKEDQL